MGTGIAGVGRWAAGAAAAVLATAGCSGDDRGDGPVDSWGDGYSVRAALAEIPASAVDGSVLVQTADLRAASRAAGLDRPEDGSREATTPWLQALSGSSPDGPARVFVPFPEPLNIQAATPDEFADVVGWSVVDVDTFAELSALPGAFLVVTGDFGDDTLASDLVEVEDDIVSDREDEDFTSDLGSVNAVSRTGTPTRLARQGDRTALSPSTPAVRSWLGGDASLADDDALASVAEVLDGKNVVSAVLTKVDPGADPGAFGDRMTPEQREALAEELDDVTPQGPFDAVGIGWAVDGGTPQVHVAYRFGSASAADDAAPVLERAFRDGSSLLTRAPWKEQMTVEETQTDGSVVTVTVTPTGDGRVSDLYQALQRREPLFVSP